MLFYIVLYNSHGNEYARHIVRASNEEIARGYFNEGLTVWRITKCQRIDNLIDDITEV